MVPPEQLELPPPVWNVGKLTPNSVSWGPPTTRRGLYRYVLEPASGPGACGKKSNSAYAFPLSTVSPDGMLKIVDCAIAVCAATTNKSATNNPERTLKLFTVITRLSPMVQKKTPSACTTCGATLDVIVFRIFCRTALCG